MTVHDEFIRACTALHYTASRHDALTRRTAETAAAIYAYWYWRHRLHGEPSPAAAKAASIERDGYLRGELTPFCLAHDLKVARNRAGIDATR